MQSPRMDSHLPPPVPYSNWIEKICYWLGRLWSFCFSPCGLAHRVDQVASERFTKDASESDVKEPTPPRSSKEGLTEEEVDDFLKAVIPSEIETQEPAEVAVAEGGNPSEVVSVKEEEKSEPPVPPKEEEPLKATDVEKKTKLPFKRRPRPGKGKPAAPKAPSKPQIINVEGKGACQLHAILRGLKEQYPEKLEYQENDKTMALTAEKLRQWGVDFIREQIDSCGLYAEDVLGYLDIDRQEYNGLLKTLKRKAIVRTDADFIKLLERSNFACSTSHLFALSILLDLPICVHDEEKEENGKEDAVQTFSPEKDREPIHLRHQREKVHYQYMLFPKGKVPKVPSSKPTKPSAPSESQLTSLPHSGNED